MGWTIIMEDENGNAIRTLPEGFDLPDHSILARDSFRLLCYLDPYGDTTFNASMFEDLITDLERLTLLVPDCRDQIGRMIEYARLCILEVHTYLKFYGD